MTEQASEAFVHHEPQYDLSNIKAVYWLYIIGVGLSIISMSFVGVFLWLIAIIWVSLLSKENMPDWIKTHARLQQRTFWLSTIYGLLLFGMFGCVLGGMLSDISGRSALSSVSSFFASGYILVVLSFLAWVLVRCIRGLQLLGKQAAYPFPERWGF